MKAIARRRMGSPKQGGIAMTNPLGLSVNRSNCSQLERYAAEGIACAELLLYAQDAPPEAPEAILAYGDAMVRRIAEAGMTLQAVHLPFSPGQWNPSHPNSTARKAAVAGQRRLIEQCARWGASYAVLHPSCGIVPDAERPALERLCVHSLRALAIAAAGYGVRILAENLPKGTLVDESAPLLRVTEGGRLAGICMNVNHLSLETHAAFIARTGAAIRSVRCSGDGGLGERRRAPGTGTIPWKQMLADLAAVGYEGPYLFEICPDEREHLSPARRLTGCLTPFFAS